MILCTVCHRMNMSLTTNDIFQAFLSHQQSSIPYDLEYCLSTLVSKQVCVPIDKCDVQGNMV